MASQKNPSSTVTATEVRELLRTAAESLSAREEKVVRMRAGARLPSTAPLPRRGQQHEEARAELFALEAELVPKLAARAAAQAKGAAKPAQAAAPPAARSKEKDKIVRALRRLK